MCATMCLILTKKKTTILFDSKQNQLWLEGAELYKGKPFAKAEPYQYGIYSIKQRELLKTANGNGIQNTSKGESYASCSFVFVIILFGLEVQNPLTFEHLFFPYLRRPTSRKYKRSIHPIERPCSEYIPKSGYHEIE